jgi:serine/threonine protein kinase
MSSHGGAIYGKGAKGRVMDLACVDSKSFCHTLVSAMTDRTGLPEITVYSLKDKQRRLTNKESLQFLSALSAAEGLLVKQFTRGTTKAATNFANEFEGIQTLHSIFGDTGVLQHTTIAFLGGDIVGFALGHTDYYVLNRKCGKDVGSLMASLTLHEINKMLEQVLRTLDILVRHDFFHKDLKLDNILWCPDTRRYTVIDWDHGLKRSQLERMLVRDRDGDAYGSGLTASPIAIFLDTGKTQATKYASSLAVYAYMNFIRKQSMSLTQARAFMAFVEERVQKPVKALLSTKPSRASLFRRYYRNFDVYSLGICLALLVFTRDLPHDYLELADSMVNVSHPRFAYTPADALSYVVEKIEGWRRV